MTVNKLGKTMFNILLQFLLGLLYANLGEWLFHKFILHGLGKNSRSIWAFHCHEHHTVCAENTMYDASYVKLPVVSWNARAKELMVFFATMLIHIPLLWYLPAFCLGLYVSLTLYYVRHRKAHLDPDWARKNLNWHYEHHINPNAGNWCVTWPWCDYLFGTRFKSDQATHDKA